MQRGLPTKDVVYDPAPYDALGQEQRDGGDVSQRVATIILATPTRPGHMATRLNLAGITTPQGGKWDWIAVRDAKAREKEQASRREWSEFMSRIGRAAQAPLPSVRVASDDDADAIVQTPWGPMTSGELMEEGEDSRGPLTAVQSRAIRAWHGKT